ncbi:vWA domain-containing protein [Planctomicrobium piriforme]|uniref:VWFA domain-containing protein n=1 Tax=Planctomicrobium piriforme TaxID=1576369 RepID=A0A1I3DN78_9PLAN|nr:VWA domain-containing protein [Planctomicrobium piriforme]SFH88194.1 hypothetical protein SAMN05421753_103333 [Planctomicrobium piriforme]
MRHWLWISGITLAFLAVAWLLAGLISAFGSSLFGEWQLVFQNANDPWRWWGLTVLCGACVATIAVLFTYERRLISWQLGFTLLGLRLALILVIFLTLLEPVWTWSYDRSQPERVLLALDVSQSMDTVDMQASELEKLRWADALGLFGSDDAQTRAKIWIADLKAGKEPEWVLPDEETDPARRERLAQVRKENLQSQLTEVAKLPRIEILRRAIAAVPDAVVGALSKASVLQLAAFAQNSAPIELRQLQQPLDPALLNIDRTHSNLADAAEAAHSGSNDAPLAGVILLSDGHDTDTPATAALVNRLQGLGVPVHTVLVGSEQRPRDLSILHVDHPETVFLKDKPLVKTILQTSGFEGESLTVYLQSLDSPDDDPLQRTIKPTGPSTEADFTLTEMPVGRHKYRIWTDVAPMETRDDNNSAEFALSVVDDRARVLVIEGESRWEFRFLDDTLSRDPQVSLECVLFEQPFLGILKKPFFPTKLDELGPAPAQGTQFAAYDLVLIGDVSPEDLRAQHWQELDRYVRQEGGTLILTAGKRFFPFAYQGTLAEELLPIVEPRLLKLDEAKQIGPPPARGFRLTIAADGDPLPMFQLDGDRAKSLRIWSELPGHLWGIVGKVRGGASVWAAGLAPGERPTLDSERQNAIIAQHYVGAGQVVWIGIDSTWRWRYLVGDVYHHRFWGQLIRWAVSFKASAGNDSLRLGLREAVIRAGQTAHVQVRIDERFLAQNPNLKAQAVLTRQAADRPYSQTIDLATREGNALLLESQAPGLPPGEYKVQLKLTGGETQQELPEVLLVVNAELTPELQDVHANRPLLEQIASATGGQFLQLNELHRLPELFQDANQTEHIREEVPLYSHWLILILFSGIAMTEWVLRKLNGLP